MESWPFKVVDDNGNPKVSVEYLGETKTFSPQEISSMVLLKVRFLRRWLRISPAEFEAIIFVSQHANTRSR